MHIESCITGRQQSGKAVPLKKSSSTCGRRRLIHQHNLSGQSSFIDKPDLWKIPAVSQSKREQYHTLVFAEYLISQWDMSLEDLEVKLWS